MSRTKVNFSHGTFHLPNQETCFCLRTFLLSGKKPVFSSMFLPQLCPSYSHLLVATTLQRFSLHSSAAFVVVVVCYCFVFAGRG